MTESAAPKTSAADLHPHVVERGDPLLTTANIITLARLALAPVVLVGIAMMPPTGSWWVWLAWTIVAGTDFVDGIVARRQGTTKRGAFLDPLADKFLVLGAMLALVSQGIFSWVPVVIIAAREGLMSAYRVFLGREGISVPARPLAKAKTLVQALAVGAVVMPPLAVHPLVGDITLWVAVALTVISFAQYIVDYRRAVRQRDLSLVDRTKIAEDASAL